MNINWGLMTIYTLCAYYWVSVYYNGFFVTTMWTIVLAAIVGIWLRVSGRA